MDALVLRVENFDAWRDLARLHLRRGTAPSRLIWQPAGDGQSFLFPSAEAPLRAEDPAPTDSVRLPGAFVECAKLVARHRDPSRWSLLYRIAWRIRNEERHLLRIETDDDVRALTQRRQAVENDIYKMRAFVRFRRVPGEETEQYVAWYRPDHHTLDANERFFVDRFGGMRWAILTPESSLIWDLHHASYGPGVPRSEAPAEDDCEELWRAYYASIYNPARRNLVAMRAQLPVRRWQDLPESRLIKELTRTSPGRVNSMIQAQRGSASQWIRPGAETAELRQCISRCEACELCGRATQPVFGEGHTGAPVMIVGEQPGDEEDRAGRPFLGPAGQILDAALRESGLDRDAVYLTNAVKAFRFEERGKRRIHQMPRAAHVSACRPWLEAEVAALRPRLIVCLGATAAQSVLGRAVQIREERARDPQFRWGAEVLVTFHPAALLRAPDEQTRVELRRALVEDLANARRRVPL